MDIYDKRDKLLNLDIAMAEGKAELDPTFSVLIDFENWCCNSGLSGFAQSATINKVEILENFSEAHDFELIQSMASVLRKYLEKYGEHFIDSLNDAEYGDLCQYDDQFHGFHDTYTDKLYELYMG